MVLGFFFFLTNCALFIPIYSLWQINHSFLKSLTTQFAPSSQCKSPNKPIISTSQPAINIVKFYAPE